MATETQITKSIVRVVKRRKAWVVKFHGGKATRAGVPDLLLCYLGFFVALEVKRPGEKATPIQEHEMSLIRAAGGVACVVTSVAEAEAVLDEVEVHIRTGVQMVGSGTGEREEKQ